MLQWTRGGVYLFTVVFLFSSDKYPEVELLGHMVALFSFFEEPPCCFPWWLHQFTIPQTMQRAPFSPQSCQHLLPPVLLIIAILRGVRWCFIVILICVFLGDVETLSLYLLAHLYVFFRKMLIQNLCASF